jgi:hypothetical protein
LTIDELYTRLKLPSEVNPANESGMRWQAKGKSSGGNNMTINPGSNQRERKLLLLIPLLLLLAAGTALGQTTSFTYQGRLTDGGTPANGSYDMQFKLYAAAAGSGLPIGSTITNSAVAVTGGVFTVQLDFGGSAFPGADRFLEISTRQHSSDPDTPAYTTLSPRQQLTSTPYAVRSGNATLADAATDAAHLGGVAADQYVQTNDSRLSDARPPTTGSSNYIQNSATAQVGANFNIAGDGIAAGTLSGNTVNAMTQYNIAGSRVLSTAGTNNMFVGMGAGQSNAGIKNSFFGGGAGFANTTGGNNSFFGSSAGAVNETGGFNSFFGSFAGVSNKTGNSNSFFGQNAGQGNVAGLNNSFFGSSAGYFSTGDGNSFLGTYAGNANTIGNSNTFLGNFAGSINSTGSNNTIIGTGANVASDNLTNATAIGANAVVNTSNTIVLGRSNGIDSVQVPGNLNVSGTLSTTSTQNVNVVNTPTVSAQQSGPWNVSLNGTPTVGLDAANNTVKIDAATPVLVRDVDNGRQPFQATAAGSFNNGFRNTGLTVITTVPAGKRLVIEHVSVEGNMLPGQKMIFASIEVSLQDSFNGNPLGHFLSIGAHGNDGFRDLYFSSQALRLYADPGTDVRGFAGRDGTAGDNVAAVYFVISGYFVNVP